MSLGVQAVQSRIGRFFSQALRRPEASYDHYGDFRAQMSMSDGGLPLLVLTLAAAAGSRLRVTESEEATTLRHAFAAAVPAMDRADLAYLRTIEETLPVTLAFQILKATAAFRNDVRAVRRQTRDQIAELYLRYGFSYGWFDPIDPYTPLATGLNHADETRIATLTDDVRSQVRQRRASVNESVSQRLQAAQIDMLIAAKRQRRQAFEVGLKQALQTGVHRYADLTPAQASKTLYELSELADGWY